MKIHCRDIDIYYETYGEGEPFVLLHGNGEDSSYFSHQIAAFSKHYQVITPDTRGHGKTSRGSEPLNFDVLADDLKCFLDALGCKHVYLLGFSDGANIALHFLLKCPEYVKKAILNSGNLFPEGMTWPMKLAIEVGYRITKIKSAIARRFHHSKFLHYHRRRELLELMQQHPMLTMEQLKQIKVPVLVIAGTRDVIRLSHTKDMAKALPNAKLVLIKGGTHCCAREMYKVFNQDVYDYLKSEENK